MRQPPQLSRPLVLEGSFWSRDGRSWSGDLPGLTDAAKLAVESGHWALSTGHPTHVALEPEIFLLTT